MVDNGVKIDVELCKVTDSTWSIFPSRAGVRERAVAIEIDKGSERVNEPTRRECDQWATLWDAWRWKA